MFALLLMLFTSGSAEARLGESFQKCAKLYGSPIGSIDIPGLIPNGVGFHRGEYSITCGFDAGKCIVMVVTRLSPTDPTLNSFPRGDVTLFMTENFGHTSWVLTKLESKKSIWRTYDLETHLPYTATFDRELNMLTLQIAGK